MKYISILLMSLLFVCCKNESKQGEIAKKRIFPSHNYNYVSIDNNKVKYSETIYLPVYSDIYQQDGTKRYPITITVSIRNTSLTDSAYIQSTSYYDSYGKILQSYVDSTILISPLESIEFVVEEKEDLGGAGANFIIEWAATKYADQILIQAVMVNAFNGFSFQTNSKIIKKEIRE
ncbi:DUF3124 domain-containing protein [uncultured Draconibacterium sp.]|uniref:DUF3124 domain-containing protein n=1 Tax=uncultured Draconibacterium sp. TaxID=1573823 RepID=UPI0025F22D9E|nr:DUF3124 domain-containing protein [uncultured Draconibacterium sp.]